MIHSTGTIPQQLLNDLQLVPGFDEVAFLAAHGHPPITSVRLHLAKGGGLFAGNEPVPWCLQGRYLPQRPVFTTDPLYHGGGYYVQEASSMFLDHVLRSVFPEKKGLRVLDLCAAPGGKSTLIASLLDPESLLISNDVIRSRATILEENMTRWGYMNTWVASNDPRDFGRLTGYFDVIVVDAPCSGSGLFRKDEHALSEWSEANVALCSQRQQRILADVWPALKEGGILIYATCSYSPQEDEEILNWLAAEYNVTALPVLTQPEWGIVTVTTENKMEGYRFFPNRVKGEGFFIAAMRKNDAAEAMKPVRFKSAHDKQVQQQAGHLLKDAGLTYLQMDKDRYIALYPGHEADLQLLKKAVYLRKAGLDMGTPTAKEWLPAHDVALSVDAAPFSCIQVSKEQALRFLKKEDMQLSGGAKGWHTIQYQGLGLGWVKALGNRVNNYLPKHWRIRMEITDADWA